MHVHINILDAIYCYVVIGLTHLMEGVLVIYISIICDTHYNYFWSCDMTVDAFSVTNGTNAFIRSRCSKWRVI